MNQKKASHKIMRGFFLTNKSVRFILPQELD